MKKKNTVKIIFMVVFILLMTIMESMLLPTLISSSFINKNTAAYMIFDIEMPEHWNESSKYTWIDTDVSYKEFINDEIRNSLNEIDVENYHSEDYLYGIASILVEKSGVEMNAMDVAEIFYETELMSYFNDFVRMQTGFLIGDNLFPIPQTTELHSELNDAINHVESIELSEWYASNENVIVSSLKAAMLDTNERFSDKIIEEHPIFSESCLILKVLNILVMFYAGLALIVIFGFCAIKLCKTKYTWLGFAISQFISAMCCAAIYFSLEDVSLVVFGVSYQANATMISDSWPVFIVLLSIELVLCGIFTAIHFIKPKNKKEKI